MKRLAYQEQFPVGSGVRIADIHVLQEFRREWKYHHPLQDEQMAFAAKNATVAWVGFYHGGDVLYELEGLPGIWHEQLLGSIPPKT